MKFYEYKKGKIKELSYPMTSDLPDEKTCFLIYAKDSKDAKRAAKEHLDGKPLEQLNNFRLNHTTTYKYIKNVAV